MRLVTCTKAEVSEAANCSPSPRPTTSGAPLRASTRRSGFFSDITAIA